MPNITTYNGPEGAIRPTDLPESAFQLEGRRIGAVGNERAAMIRQGGVLAERTANLQARAVEGVGKQISSIGEVVERHEGQQEILAGFPKLAQLHDQLDQLHTTLQDNADPYDPNLRDQYGQAVTSVLENFRSSFNTPLGKAWATRQGALAETEIYRHSVAADAERAKAMAATSLTETTNTLSGLAARNPAQLDTALGMLPETLTTLEKNNPALAGFSQEMELKMGQQIATAGIRAAITANPSAGLGLLNSGRYDRFIDNKDRNTLERLAEHAGKVQDLQSKAGELVQRKTENDTIAQAGVALHASTITDQGVALPQDYWKNYDRILNMPGAERHAPLLNELARYGKQLQDHETAQQAAAERGERAAQKFNAANTTDVQTLEHVLGVQAGPSENVYQATDLMRMKGLSPTDKQWLIQQDNPTARAALGRLSGALEYAKQLVAGPDPASRTTAGMDAYNQAAHSVIAAYQDGLRRGLTPDQLLDPQSKDYVARTDRLQTFMAPPTTIRVNKAGPHFLHPFNLPHPAVAPTRQGFRETPNAVQSFRETPNAAQSGIAPPTGAWPFRGLPVDTQTGELPHGAPGVPQPKRPSLHAIFSTNPADEVAKDVENEGQ